MHTRAASYARKGLTNSSWLVENFPIAKRGLSVELAPALSRGDVFLRTQGYAALRRVFRKTDRLYPNNMIYGSHLFLLSGNEAWESEASHVAATCLPNENLHGGLSSFPCVVTCQSCCQTSSGKSKCVLIWFHWERSPEICSWHLLISLHAPFLLCWF